MKRLRFSLLAMLGVVALVAVACAALRSASDIWASAAYSITVGVLFVALLGLIFRQRTARAFWGGFALLGWGYLILVFGPWLRENVGPQLLTTKVLDYLHPKLQRSVTPPALGTSNVNTVTLNGWNAANVARPATTGAWLAPGNTDIDGDGVADLAITNAPVSLWAYATAVGTPALVLPTAQHFMQVGHSLWALLLACAGGLLARYFYDTQTRPKQEAVPGLKT